jgi:hypothetical protein
MIQKNLDFSNGYDRGTRKSLPEVNSMARTFLILLFAFLWLTTVAFAQQGKPEKNLIPVTPATEESVSGKQQAGSSAGPNAPTPSEQMYVFWYLGRIISYPVDTVEAYIKSWMTAPKPVAVPASGSSASNPFDSVKWRAIPPAPPVTNSSSEGR